MIDPLPLLSHLRELHDHIRDTVVSACGRQDAEGMSAISRDIEGDTIYAIDAVTEQILTPFFERLSQEHSFVLIAEGLEGGRLVFPRGIDEAAAAWRIIMDPIDGTRAIMYQKRSAWILTGVAPNLGPQTGLRDIVLAVQTEIPLLKQHLSDELSVVQGQSVIAHRYNRLTGGRTPLRLRPSQAPTIAHGFAMISRFFPGARAELAAIDDEIAAGALGPIREGKAQCFEDQYVSTGGQLYELMAGHDRFVADLRPLTEKILAERGQRLGICCHPYDLSASAIASALGVILTDAAGAPLNARLAVEDNVAWVGYASERIRQQVEPLLQAALRKRGWI
jgi:hypothetical protein